MDVGSLVFEKNANFFAENLQKWQTIVIITSTPGGEYRLLSDLCKANADILADAYPELAANLAKVDFVLQASILRLSILADNFCGQIFSLAHFELNSIQRQQM
jgi:hypothetical protein